MKPFLLNLALAGLWFLLQQRWSLFSVVTGFVLGFALQALFPTVLGSRNYVRRALGLGKFALVFLRLYFAGFGHTLWIVLFVPARRLQPRFIEHDIRGLTGTEIFLLSQCISLTPGTVVVEISPDRSRALLHSLDAPNPDAINDELKLELRPALLAFTR